MGGVVDDMALLMIDEKFVVDIWESFIYPFVSEFEDRVARLGEDAP